MSIDEGSMDDRRNAIDLELLRSDHRALLLRYRETIGIIVRTYIRTGMFHPSEADDIIQQLSLELLEKMPRISEQFNGTSLVRTYLSSIIRHSCLNLYKKRQTSPPFVDIEATAMPAAPGDPDNRLALEQSLRMLDAILTQYHTDRPKLVVCLKIMYRIPLTREDVRTWWPACPEPDVDALVAFAQQMDRTLTDKQAFALIHPFMMRAEQRTSSHDSIRRWTDERITQIVQLLNGNPPASTHTKETLGLLLEEAAAPFLWRR
jgi:DNA-directed RNA polymerase specialized sigma24 family protein